MLAMIRLLLQTRPGYTAHWEAQGEMRPQVDFPERVAGRKMPIVTVWQAAV
jgi:hypothetical protein